MKTHRIGVIAVIIVLVAVSTVSALTVSVDNAKIPMKGGTAQVVIYLDEVPKGIAGYNVSLAVSDPDVAEILQVTLPLWGFPGKTSSLPSDNVWITGIDFSRTVQAGASDIALGTITIRGLKEGKTDLKLTVVRIDDDAGYPVKPSVQEGVITIGDEKILTMKSSETHETTPIIPEISFNSADIPSRVVSSTFAITSTPPLKTVGDNTAHVKEPILLKGNITESTTTNTRALFEKTILDRVVSFFRELSSQK